MEDIASYVEILRRIVQRIGPYLFVELVMPGGSLLALALFLYRRRQAQGLAPVRWSGVLRRVGAALDSVVPVSMTVRSDR
jgi:hypothetical protein